MAKEWALGAAILFAILTAARIRLDPKSRWQALLPGGIAVAVGKFSKTNYDNYTTMFQWLMGLP